NQVAPRNSAGLRRAILSRIAGGRGAAAARILTPSLSPPAAVTTPITAAIRPIAARTRCRSGGARTRRPVSPVVRHGGNPAPVIPADPVSPVVVVRLLRLRTGGRRSGARRRDRSSRSGRRGPGRSRLPFRRIGVDLDHHLAADFQKSVPLLDTAVGDLFRIEVEVIR